MCFFPSSCKKTDREGCFLNCQYGVILDLLGFPINNSLLFLTKMFLTCLLLLPASEQAPVVLDDQVIFCLTVSLDKLPANTLKAKVRDISFHLNILAGIDDFVIDLSTKCTKLLLECVKIPADLWPVFVGFFLMSKWVLSTSFGSLS